MAGHFSFNSLLPKLNAASRSEGNSRSISSYQYQPLEEGQIRLLHPLNLPGHYSLRTTPLIPPGVARVTGPEPAHFIALSYTWGDPAPTCTIYIDGSPFRIGQNLQDALANQGAMRTRPYGNPSGRPAGSGTEPLLPFWVDAICINQEDLDEKMKQVALMRRIYESALNVLVWLGPAVDQDVTFALARLSQWYGLLQPLLSGCHERDFDGRQEGVLNELVTANSIFYDDHHLEPAMFTPAEMRERGIEPSETRTWHGLAKLCSLPWWTRAWTVQEATAKYAPFIGLPRLKNESGSGMFSIFPSEALKSVGRLWVQYGLWHVPWFQLAMAHDIAKRLLRDSRVLGHEVNVVNIRKCISAVGPLLPVQRAFFRCRNDEEKKADVRQHLLELLTLNRRRDCSVPLDKIYAVRTFATDVPAPDLPADYTISWEALFIDVANWCLQNSPPNHRLDILGHVFRPDNSLTGSQKALDCLPTWVPNWRLRPQVDSQPLPKYRFVHYEDSTASERDPRDDFLCVYMAGISPSTSEAFEVKGRELHLTGVKICAVKTTSKTWVQPELHMYDKLVASGFPLPHLSDSYSPLGGTEPLVGKEVFEWAFAKMLVAGVARHKQEFSYEAFGSGDLPLRFVTNRGNLDAGIDLDDELRQIDAQRPSGIDDETWEKIRQDELQFTAAAQRGRDRMDQLLNPELPLKSSEAGAVELMDRALCGRRIFLSGDNHVGLGPAAMRDGDLICIFFGSQTPHILRPVSEERFEYVGECYVHGLMDWARRNGGKLGAGSESRNEGPPNLADASNAQERASGAERFILI
ncbi:Fc.00g023680.m01.CDS01 [Cosmosporella sp. VM-42]